MATCRRAKAVLGYLKGKSVISLAEALDVTRGAINRWLQWYEADGVDGLRTLPVPGRTPKLDAAQQQALIKLIASFLLPDQPFLVARTSTTCAACSNSLSPTTITTGRTSGLARKRRSDVRSSGNPS